MLSPAIAAEDAEAYEQEYRRCVLFPVIFMTIPTDGLTRLHGGPIPCHCMVSLTKRTSTTPSHAPQHARSTPGSRGMHSTKVSTKALLSGGSTIRVRCPVTVAPSPAVLVAQSFVASTNKITMHHPCLLEAIDAYNQCHEDYNQAVDDADNKKTTTTKRALNCAEKSFVTTCTAFELAIAAIDNRLAPILQQLPTAI
jgi:hypothetical protein